MGFGNMLSKFFKKQEAIKANKETSEQKDFNSIIPPPEPRTQSFAFYKTMNFDGIVEMDGNNEKSSNESSGRDDTTDTEGEEMSEDDTGDSNILITDDKVYEVLGEIYDPEIPIDIVNLGLIYDVKIDNSIVNVIMTMTSPGCPVATQIVSEAKFLIEELPGVKEANIEIVWDPPWDPSMMSDVAKESLGM